MEYTTEVKLLISIVMFTAFIRRFTDVLCRDILGIISSPLNKEYKKKLRKRVDTNLKQEMKTDQTNRSSDFCTAYPTPACPRGHEAGDILDRVTTLHRAQAHTHSHDSGQFVNANQPTSHVFGMEEETGVPGGNPH